MASDFKEKIAELRGSLQPLMRVRLPRPCTLCVRKRRRHRLACCMAQAAVPCAQQAQEGLLPTSKGVTYLEVKWHMLMA